MIKVAERIIAVIDESGKSVRFGKTADEHIKTLPINNKSNVFSEEVLKKLDDDRNGIKKSLKED